MSGRITSARNIYINSVNRWLLSRGLITDYEALQAIQELQSTNNRAEMKRIYNRYNDKARTTASTQGMTIEQFEEDRNRDFEGERDQDKDAADIQAYIRAKMAEKLAQRRRTEMIDKQELDALRETLESMYKKDIDAVEKSNFTPEQKAGTINNFNAVYRALRETVERYVNSRYRETMKKFVMDVLQTIQLRSTTPYKVLENIKKFNAEHVPERQMVKTIPRSPTSERYTIGLNSITQYRNKRREELVKFYRVQSVPVHIRQKLDLLVENQIERFALIQEFEEKIKYFREQYNRYNQTERHEELIPIESLTKLAEKEFYEFEYYQKYKVYEDLIKYLEQKGSEFLNALFQFINAHEDALLIYKREVGEMYIQFAFAVTATHDKELEQKQRRMKQEPIERQQLHAEEERIRRSIQEEQQRLTQINVQYSSLIQAMQQAKNEEERKRIEQQIKKRQQDIEVIKGNIMRMQGLEQEQREQIFEAERLQHIRLLKERDQYKQIPEQPQPVPVQVPTTADPVVVPKPPKEISQPVSIPQYSMNPETATQTAQTQTLLPLNSFKMIEKNNQKFLEPINPLKAEELSRIKKTVMSVVLLDPNRYERKPHVTKSHRVFR